MASTIDNRGQWQSDPTDWTISSVKSGHLRSVIYGQPTSVLTPWYVVPANEENARLIVSHIVLDTLHGLNMAYPKTTAKRRRELTAIRKLLAKERGDEGR